MTHTVVPSAAGTVNTAEAPAINLPPGAPAGPN